MDKIGEIRAIIGDDYDLVTKDIDLPEYQGEPEEIVRKKLLIALERCGEIKNVIGLVVDDSSLFFNALGGLPGPYIKWFLKSCGLSGLHRMLADFEDKSAYATCVIGFCRLTSVETSEIRVFTGKVNGTIVAPRGNKNFGYPIFQPDGFEQTYAEMDPEVKNRISHRSLAIRALKAFLDAEFNTKVC